MQCSCLQEIMTDNGLEFCNVLMNIVPLQMNVKHITTNHYHPRWNGFTWWFNRTLCALLEKNDSPNNKWQELLHDIFFANGTIPKPTTHHLTLYCPQGLHGLFAKMRGHLSSWGNGSLQKKIVWTSGMPTAIQPWCMIEDSRLNEKDGTFARPRSLQTLHTFPRSLCKLFYPSLLVETTH
jgi:hypothetical protein